MIEFAYGEKLSRAGDGDMGNTAINTQNRVRLYVDVVTSMLGFSLRYSRCKYHSLSRQ